MQRMRGMTVHARRKRDQVMQGGGDEGTRTRTEAMQQRATAGRVVVLGVRERTMRSTGTMLTAKGWECPRGRRMKVLYRDSVMVSLRWLIEETVIEE